jgi:hypothetical protein
MTGGADQRGTQEGDNLDQVLGHEPAVANAICLHELYGVTSNC